jgi:glycosyltransferase involved in cell wall biosynthesis
LRDSGLKADYVKESLPLVTIGVCVRNCASTIHEAIKSIITQDYPHEFMEVIVVDGYSNDKTVQIVKKTLYSSDIKTRIIFDNNGLGFARQIIVDNAVGDYVVWVDGDMILPKDFVRKQVQFMEQHPKVGIAKGRYGIFKETSLVAILENIEFIMAFRQEREVTSEPLGASGCIYRVKAIKQVGGFDKNIKGAGEDEDAEYRVKAAGWTLYLSSACFYERRRKTWQALLRQYYWHGKGAYYLLKKKTKYINVYKMFPLALLFAKFIQSVSAYKFTHQKVVFLLPVHYIFKRIAWFFGFLRAYVGN